jgi:hypothetical protein
VSDEPFEVDGQWWLPEAPASPAIGRLAYSPGAGSILTVFGTLRDPFVETARTSQGDGTVTVTRSLSDSVGSYPRILGIAGNRQFTLEDCLQTSVNNLGMGAQSTETVSVSTIYRDVWFEPGERPEATAISFGLRYLTNWIGESGITEQWPQPRPSAGPPDRADFILEAQARPELKASTASGTVRLVHTVGLAGDGVLQRAVTQGYRWGVSRRRLTSVQDFLSVASDLQALVTMGTNVVAGLESVEVEHPQVWRTFDPEGKGKKHRRPIAVLAPWNTFDNEPPNPLHPTQMFFTFADIGRMAGVRKWMDTAAVHRGSIGRVLSTRYASGQYLSSQLLNCSSGLEGFDRTRTQTTNSKFKARLRRCAQHAGDPFLKIVGDVETWAEAVRIERDDAAHHLGQARLEPAELYFLTQSLYLLFVICMMCEIQAPSAAMARFEGNQTVAWLTSRIRAALGT